MKIKVLHVILFLLITSFIQNSGEYETYGDVSGLLIMICSVRVCSMISIPSSRSLSFVMSSAPAKNLRGTPDTRPKTHPSIPAINVVPYNLDSTPIRNRTTFFLHQTQYWNRLCWWIQKKNNQIKTNYYSTRADLLSRRANRLETSGTQISLQ